MEREFLTAFGDPDRQFAAGFGSVSLAPAAHDIKILEREPCRIDFCMAHIASLQRAMAVELLPDGTVGEVKVAQGLDPGLDQMAIASARKLIFVPAIKNRKFVSVWSPMTMGFNIY